MKLLERIERLAEAREKATDGEWQCFGNALIPPKPENIGLSNSYNDAEMLAQAANEIIPLRDEVRALVEKLRSSISADIGDDFEDACKWVLDSITEAKE